MDTFKLTRDNILDILNELNITIPGHTRLKTDRLRHRLERALDAAQRYPSLLEGESDTIDPSSYPIWSVRQDVTEGLYRQVWGGFVPEMERSGGAFSKMCHLIVGLGECYNQGIQTVIFSDNKTAAIVIQILSIHTVRKNRPLLVVGYAAFTETGKAKLKRAVGAFCSLDMSLHPSTIYATAVEQALALHLLAQNREHLSGDFVQPVRINSQFSFSFLLPTTWLSMKDIGRLNKTTGCAICGNITRSECFRCQSVQYCSKECQKNHWPEHQHLCRTIRSGIWYTIIGEPHPRAELEEFCSTVINRYDDLEEDLTVEYEEDRHEIPPNLYGDRFHLVKLQLPIMGRKDHIYMYDKRKTYQVFVREEHNWQAFAAAVRAMGMWPKMYRWAQRVGDWEWKICVDREPEFVPRW